MRKLPIRHAGRENSAETAAGGAFLSGWETRLKPVYCHPFDRMERYREAKPGFVSYRLSFSAPSTN